MPHAVGFGRRGLKCAHLGPKLLVLGPGCVNLMSQGGSLLCVLLGAIGIRHASERLGEFGLDLL
jgi:hypothetical protein